MAVATTHITLGKGLSFDVLAPFKAIANWFVRQNHYRHTMDELSVLNDRDLKDLGLSRSSLKHVAKQAANEAFTQG